MRYKAFKDISLSSLGLGNMRLPLIDPKDGKSGIDYPKAHEIIDSALAQGINYFDTAYVYNAGDSEKCLGECMKKHDRSSFYLATKYNVNANPDYKAVFEEQLERLQTDYIDFYLIHCILDSNIDKYLTNGCIDYFMDLKAQGKIKYLGFSSHASVATLERFADHHQWDFAQLQINYYDWVVGTSKAEYEALVKRNIPIMVMEPVRGGRLADLTAGPNDMLKAKHADWSIASWALRFVDSLPGVTVVLSGMSTTEQVDDNIKTFSDDTTFTKEDEATVFEAANLFRKNLLVPCTACRYCTADCPKQINIPEFLKLYNEFKVEGPSVLGGISKIESVGKPADCIACKKCMGHCPQGINIPDRLKELA